MMDFTYGNIDAACADRLADASIKPPGFRIADVNVYHQPGDTEPWVARLVADLVVARDAFSVLETGGFNGTTSLWLYDALDRLGRGYLTVCEIDRERATKIANRLKTHKVDTVGLSVMFMDVTSFLATTDLRFDLAFVDDDHTKAHVTKELTLLYPKMNPGGLICLHDAFGSCDLQSVIRRFGGYSLDFPRLGPAGGLGFIQAQ